MPYLEIPLAVTYDNITRRAALTISRDIMNITGIDENSPLYITNEFQANAQPGGIGLEDKVQFKSYNQVNVEISDTLRYSSLMSMNYMNNEEPPLFEDRRLGISVRPVYVESDMVFNFAFRAGSQTEARQWIGSMARKLGEGRGSHYHEINYDIPIHDGLLVLFAHFNELIENIGGYGESFNDYFQRIQQKQVTGLGATDGDMNKVLLVIPENQTQITGYFDFGDLPKEVKVDGDVMWDVEFQYKVLYKHPIQFYVVYPMMIHQQWISQNYFSQKPYYGLEEVNKRGAIGVKAFDMQDGYYGYFPAPVDGVRFPAFDEWIPQRWSQANYSVPGITWMLQLDPKDPQDLLNLSEIPDVRFTKEMIDFLRIIYPTLHLQGSAPCWLTLFVDDKRMAPGTITIDKDLNVRAAINLDIRRQYHLRLSFNTNYSLFNRQAIRWMEDNPLPTLQIFQTILPTLDVEQGLSLLIDELYMKVDYIEWFYHYLQQHGIGFTNDEGSGSSTGPGGGTGGLVPDTPGEYGDGKTRAGNTGGRYIQYLAIIAKK